MLPHRGDATVSMHGYIRVRIGGRALAGMALGVMLIGLAATPPAAARSRVYVVNSENSFISVIDPLTNTCSRPFLYRAPEERLSRRPMAAACTSAASRA